MLKFKGKGSFKYGVKMCEKREREREERKERNVTNPVNYVLYIPLILDARCCLNLYFTLSQIFGCSANIFRNYQIVVLGSSWYGCAIRKYFL